MEKSNNMTNKKDLAKIINLHKVSKGDDIKPEDITDKMLSYYNSQMESFKKKYPEYDELNVDDYIGEADDIFVDLLIETANMGGFTLVESMMVHENADEEDEFTDLLSKYKLGGKGRITGYKSNEYWFPIEAKDDLKKIDIAFSEQTATNKDHKDYGKKFCVVPWNHDLHKKKEKPAEKLTVDEAINRFYEHLYAVDKDAIAGYESVILECLDRSDPNPTVLKVAENKRKRILEVTGQYANKYDKFRSPGIAGKAANKVGTKLTTAWTDLTKTIKGEVDDVLTGDANLNR